MSERGFLAEAIDMLMCRAQPLVVRHDNRTFVQDGLTELAPHEPELPIYRGNTLAGLVSVIRAEMSCMRGLPLLVQVAGPGNVVAYSSLCRGLVETDKSFRYRMYEVENDNRTFKSGSYSQEDLSIKLRSMCLPTPDQDYLLDMISRIDMSTGVSISDDGITQKVVQRVGAQLKDELPVKPLLLLKPFRTFVEVEQPISEYLLRLSRDGSISLFEADGGAWRLEARQNIAAYLEKALKELIQDGKVVVML